MTEQDENLRQAFEKNHADRQAWIDARAEVEDEERDETMTGYDTTSLIVRGQASTSAEGTAQLFAELVRMLQEQIPVDGVPVWDRIEVTNEIMHNENYSFLDQSVINTWNIVQMELLVLMPRSRDE